MYGQPDMFTQMLHEDPVIEGLYIGIYKNLTRLNDYDYYDSMTGTDAGTF